ncbi:DUF7017 domain-containing protein [Capnocytophaga canis]|uniref:Uncharacterized protein n=1 Tax=Capnocytophaga canis TaxID=1848903 RepID=A0A0B7I2V2_9FLAO|nr:hypothetical protein [Capnocytophaga canis]CEN44437.1 conserved hypothetical protein [Capnocytophaga canis]
MTTVTELRKAGKLKEAWELANSQLEKNPNDIWVKRDLAWVYYEYLKQYASVQTFTQFNKIINKLLVLQLPEEENILYETVGWQFVKIVNNICRQGNIDYSKINTLFEHCKSLYFQQPSDLYSAILKNFHKAYKNNHQKYIEFVDWWDLDNLQEKDFQKEHYDGQDIAALADQVYCAYAKHLLPFKNIYQETIFDKEKAENFLPKLEEIAAKHPNYQYISYYQAKILLALGNNENMLSALLPFARKKKNDFWVWDILADAFYEDKEKVFACYCKGLLCPADEKMTTKLREKVIPFFLERQLFNEAKAEVDTIIRIKKANEHKIPVQISSYQNTQWYQGANANQHNRSIYRQFATSAEDILFGNLAEEVVIIENINSDKKIVNIITQNSERLFFKYDKFLKNPQIGKTYKIRFTQKEINAPSKVATLSEYQDTKLTDSYIKEFSGKINIPKNKNFGFVDDIFINPQLFQKYDLTTGDYVTGKAIQTIDKKTGKPTWKVFSLSKNH